MQYLEDGKKDLKSELRSILATKNTLRHKTTGYIPFELHRGRLLHRTEASEDEEKIVAYMRLQAAECITKAAAKSCERWKKNKRVKMYEVGEPVWVKQRNVKLRHGHIWQRKATIHSVKGNYTYRLLWGAEGGYDMAEKPYSISLRCWLGRDLKPRINATPEASETESDPEYDEEEENESELPNNEIDEEEEEANVLEAAPKHHKSQAPKRTSTEAESSTTPKGKEHISSPPRQRRCVLPGSPRGRSLSHVFSQISVENVDLSLRSRKAKKAGTKK